MLICCEVSQKEEQKSLINEFGIIAAKNIITTANSDNSATNDIPLLLMYVYVSHIDFCILFRIFIFNIQTRTQTYSTIAIEIYTFR